MSEFVRVPRDELDRAIKVLRYAAHPHPSPHADALEKLSAAPSPPEGDAEPRLIAALRRLNRYHVDDDGLTHVDAGGEWIDAHDIDRLLTTHGHGGGGEGGRSR